MQYLLMLYADQDAGLQIPADQMAKAMEALGAYQAALEKAGAFVMTSPLDLVQNARTVRVEGGEVMQASSGAFVNQGGEMKVHDGPYADTREQLGGFYMIECASMAEAVEWAKKCPAAQWGSIEVRAMRPGFEGA